jgi:hypothetical protein
MPLSLFAMMDSVMMRRFMVGAFWQVPGRWWASRRSGRLRRPIRSLRTMNFGMSRTTELSLLGLIAAAMGGYALAAGDYAFSLVFMVLSLVAVAHVFRAGK